jgi:hypothetical protein
MGIEIKLPLNSTRRHPDGIKRPRPALGGPIFTGGRYFQFIKHLT